jgi:hypothetical protein
MLLPQVTESGQESTAAVFHGIRLGMALAGEASQYRAKTEGS